MAYCWERWVIDWKNYHLPARFIFILINNDQGRRILLLLLLLNLDLHKHTVLNIILQFVQATCSLSNWKKERIFIISKFINLILINSTGIIPSHLTFFILNYFLLMIISKKLFYLSSSHIVNSFNCHNLANWFIYVHLSVHRLLF